MYLCWVQAYNQYLEGGGRRIYEFDTSLGYIIKSCYK